MNKGNLLFRRVADQYSGPGPVWSKKLSRSQKSVAVKNFYRKNLRNSIGPLFHLQFWSRCSIISKWPGTQLLLTRLTLTLYGPACIIWSGMKSVTYCILIGYGAGPTLVRKGTCGVMKATRQSGEYFTLLKHRTQLHLDWPGHDWMCVYTESTAGVSGPNERNWTVGGG